MCIRDRETVTDEEAKAALENTIKEIEEKNLDFLTGFMALEAEEGVTAVSYTHLDVYKRQI